MEQQANCVRPRSSVHSRGPAPDGECVYEFQRYMLEEQHQALGKDQAYCRKQNMMKERNRRRRIAISCEHLRELLPGFDGRRSDMASVLEMTVKYLELVRKQLPTEQASAVLAPPREMSQAPQGTKMDGDVVLRGYSRETVNGSQGQHGEKKAKMANISTSSETSNLSQKHQVYISKASPGTKIPSKNGNASPLDLKVKMMLCNYPEKSGAWSSPPQQSPLLSSSSQRWLSYAQDTCQEHLLPLSPTGDLTQSALDVLLADSMQPNAEIIEAIPFLPCAIAEQWMDERDRKESLPGTREQTPVLGALDLTLLRAPEKPDDGIKAWELAASSPDLAYHDEMDMTFTDIFQFEL
ncbi:spermatogenesis- and oogenesis-specific basic helix-loop-helix-containing protein 1 isoform X2 [Rhinatrema bivittatum]|uniref:spermatogenesis- and oogenesis-specific basic helix-loop-helix-containing protein 1 isoform X2 n=1 Tax=Rhinatrema bivittatum TaxID=194408 RepID=UPI00112EE6C1|nr:spermatogenesis- and oogenesis-specific basic helix-loop-helix-containing protein 1 isoform X2 [Rhinatrema bivittatum]